MLIHLLLACALIWQGAAAALASGRMASFDLTVGGALCSPGGGDPRSSDAQAILDHALCASHCGAVVAAALPAPPALPTRVAFVIAGRDVPASQADAALRRSPSPPARGPPSLS